MMYGLLYIISSDELNKVENVVIKVDMLKLVVLQLQKQVLPSGEVEPN